MLKRIFPELTAFDIFIFRPLALLPLSVSQTLSVSISHATIFFICCLQLGGNVKSNPIQLSCWSAYHLMHCFMLCLLHTPWHDAADCQFTGRASDVATYALQLLLGPWWDQGCKVMMMCWERQTLMQHTGMQQVASDIFDVSVGLQGGLQDFKCIKSF